MIYGVTETGFVRKTMSEILATFESGWQDIFGDDVDLSADTPDAQILGTVAGAIDEVWQTMAAVYQSFRPRQAVGASLSDLVALNAITRKTGTKSFIQATVTGTPATVIGLTAIIETVNGDRFFPISVIVIPGGGSIVATFRAISNGPITVGPNELTVIVTPISGWASIDNGVTTTSSGAPNAVGTSDESDAELRARQILSTENSATNILESLYSAILQLDGVSRCRVYVNDTSGTVDGRPAHSYEVVVVGGDDAEVAQAIWENHPTGIELFGTTTENITDSQGYTQAIKFTRPTVIPIIVEVTLSATANYPATGDDDIKQALVDYAAGSFEDDFYLGIGDDVFLNDLYTAINSVQGHHVISLEIGDPTLGTADIVIDETEISGWQISDITVIS